MGLNLKTGSALGAGSGLGLGLGNGHGYAAAGSILGLSIGTLALALGGTILLVLGIKKLVNSSEKKPKTKQLKGQT
jgi:hypothetical protein